MIVQPDISIGIAIHRHAPSTRILRVTVVALLTLALAGCGGGWRHTISDCRPPAASGSADIARHLRTIEAAPLCYRREEVREGPFHWVFHVLEHRKAPDGPFWVLPHDNENTAFAAALHAVLTYGGGLLAVDSGGHRSHFGQDPNRNFSVTAAESRLCVAQRVAAPGYTSAILNHYKGRRGPYLAMHNNEDGWHGNGGRGTISVHRVTPVLYGFPAATGAAALRDEDNLVVLAGLGTPATDPALRRRVAALNDAGLNVQYKRVTDRSFDCSLSDYVARHRLGDYYNIEAQHGRRDMQVDMVARLMNALGIRPLRRPPTPNPFLN